MGSLLSISPHSILSLFQLKNMMEAQSTAVNYLPIIFQMVVAIGFVVGTMAVTHLIGPRRNTSDKLIPFESGIKSIGNARQPFSIKYFLVAILFVLFDVEVIFMYPWAVNFRDFGVNGLIEMFIFMGTLLLGFIYILKKGALDWD
jgi:NADH-quinone oxidoreductase subunit A